MISMLFALSLILIINILIFFYMRKRKFRSLNNIPGPKSYPVVGSLLECGFNLVDVLKNLVRYTYQFKNKPFFKMWLGPWHLYLVTADPQFMEFLLSSSEHIAKSVDYDVLKPWLKNGLITSNGSYWRKHRILINSAFHLKILESYVAIFNSASKPLIEILGRHVDKGDFDVHPYISNYTLDTIIETAFGISMKIQTEDNMFAKVINEGYNIVANRMTSVWKKFDILFQFSSDYKTLQKLVEYGLNLVQHIIDERRKKLLSNNENEVGATTDDVDIRKKKIFLDTLLHGTIDGKPLSDEEIIEQVNTFLVAGADTVSDLVTFALYELSRNPEIQNKLFLEVKDVYRNDKSYEPTLEDLNDLKYTKLVLKETSRLYPAVPFIARQLEVDVNYKGTIIPKDTIIVLFIYGMHRREDLFPRASKFDPDRFLPQSNTIMPFSYIPFSAGPRNCIGQKFGMYEAACILSKIVMNYEILPAGDSTDELQLAATIKLIVPDGVHVQLKRRQIRNNTSPSFLHTIG